MDEFMQAAIDEARAGMAEEGVPIGSVLVVDGKIMGRGHNRQNQQNSVILHAEMDCLENAGHLQPAEYRRAILYTTLSPCEMCAGSVLFFKIPKVVIAENQNYRGAEDLLQAHGVELEILNDADCIQMLRDFDQNNPGAWKKGE
jgi:creatinine deaminase